MDNTKFWKIYENAIFI